MKSNFFSGIKKVLLNSSLFRNDEKQPEPKECNPPHVRGTKLGRRESNRGASCSSKGGEPGSNYMSSGLYIIFNLYDF